MEEFRAYLNFPKIVALMVSTPLTTYRNFISSSAIHGRIRKILMQTFGNKLGESLKKKIDMIHIVYHYLFLQGDSSVSVDCLTRPTP